MAPKETTNDESDRPCFLLRRWEFQWYNGWNNNANQRDWGAVESNLVYLAPPAYDDGVFK